VRAGHMQACTHAHPWCLHGSRAQPPAQHMRCCDAAAVLHCCRTGWTAQHPHNPA
jgi:hypothetical protein